MKAYVLFSHLPVLLSMVYAAIVFNRLGKQLQVFCSFLMLSGLVQLVSLIFWLKQVNNLPLLHIYVPLGFFCLTLFYHNVLKDIINKYILWAVLFLFVGFSVVNTIFFQPINTYNSNALTVESVLIVIYSLSTFTLMLNNIAREKKMNSIQSLNWVNSGLFIYYASSLFIFYFGSSLAVHSAPLVAKYAWAFHAFFSIVMYVFFIIGLWKAQRN